MAKTKSKPTIKYLANFSLDVPEDLATEEFSKVLFAWHSRSPETYSKYTEKFIVSRGLRRADDPVNMSDPMVIILASAGYEGKRAKTMVEQEHRRRLREAQTDAILLTLTDNNQNKFPPYDPNIVLDRPDEEAEAMAEFGGWVNEMGGSEEIDLTQLSPIQPNEKSIYEKRLKQVRQFLERCEDAEPGWVIRMEFEMEKNVLSRFNEIGAEVDQASGKPTKS